MTPTRRTFLTTAFGATLALAAPGTASAATSPAAQATPTASATGGTGTTYYVDSQSGNDTADGTTPTTPWRTLPRVNQHTFQPGDTLRFATNRTWTGQLAPKGSGTAAAPVTVTSYGTGTKPLLAGNAAVPSTVLLENLKHWTLDGLEVTNGTGGTSWRTGVEVRAKDIGPVPGIVLRNLYVHGMDGIAQVGKGNIGSAGILVNVRGNTTPTYFTGMLIENNEIADTKAYGITTWSTWMRREGWNELWGELGIPTTEYGTFTPSTGLVIRNNYVHDVGSGGINPNQVADTLIEYNTVARPTSTTTNVGIWWSGADRTTVQFNEVYGTRFGGRGLDCTAFDADASSHDSLIQYNYSHDNGGGFFISVSLGTAPASAVIRYNISQHDGNEIFTFSTNTDGVDIYNNTIYVAPTSTSARPLYKIAQVYHNPKNVTFRNNLIVNQAKLAYDTAGITYRNNLYAGGPVPPDTAALTGAPKLTAPGTATSRNDLAGYKPLSGSAAIAAGLAISGNGGRDILGAALPTASAPDIGAVQAAPGSQGAPVASTTLGTGQGSIAAIVDGSDATSWGSKDPAVLPGTVTVDLRTARTVGSVTLATHFGQGQGFTKVDVQTWDGSTWTTRLTDAALTWNSNTATVERRTLTLPAPVTTSQVRLVVKAANTQWGNVALNELTVA
ncbi:discoidin domain-containing protein [Streptomyces sp. NPDC004111]|uniref:discoidin domain-containing protein n=1 Tax=Streptomyces sp. NPDC004111 TaxID=3364690 RepID=UPI0036CE7042